MTLNLHLMENTQFSPCKGIISKNFNADVMVLERPLTKNTKPPKFSITLFKNPDTKTDFIVQVLSTIFHKSQKEIKEIISQIHEKGSGLCGVYTKEIAETKIDIVRKLAELSQSSLKCKMQKE